MTFLRMLHLRRELLFVVGSLVTIAAGAIALGRSTIRTLHIASGLQVSCSPAFR